MSDFETFTREKIAKLRAEADGLERALKEFQGTMARAASAGRRPSEPTRSGAFGVVLEAIQGAGVEGMDLDGMVAAAEAAGFDVKRPTLRAQVWKAKEDDLLTQIEPGRYRSSAFDDFVEVTLPATINPLLQGAAATSKALSEYKGGGPAAVVADLDDEIPF